MGTQKFEKLFEPIKIGPVEIKNRIVEAPMNQQGDRDGHPTMQYICCHNARALGGFGLIVSGAILTDKNASNEYPFIPYMYPGCNNMGYWFDFTESIRSMGTDTKVFAQMCIGIGRQGARPGCRTPSEVQIDPNEVIKRTPKKIRNWFQFFPSNFVKHLGKLKMSEFTIDQIKEAERRFVRASELAMLAGFDGIEIHACHGYLMHTFLTPRVNRRTDEYGGSVRNRARLLLNLVRGCRETFGDAVPVTVRISGREYQPDGLTPEDVQQICKLCQENGADGIHLSNGSGYDDEANFLTTTRDNTQLIEAQGKALKKVISIPVITVGIHTPELAEKYIADGETDMISLGRQAMVDPAWPNKVREGRLDEIVKCNKDCYCIEMGVYSGQQSLRCTVNGVYGKEQYDPKYWPRPLKATIPPTLRRWKPGLKWKDVWDIND